MTTAEWIDRIQRLPSGGVVTDENRWDYGYMKTILNTFSRKTIRLLYTGDRYTAMNKRINVICYQDFYPQYSKFLQDNDCYNLFEVPPVISIEEHADGFRYVGTPDNSQAFKRLKDEADLSNLNYLSKFAPKDGTYISYLPMPPYLRVYGQNVKDFKVTAVFMNPFDIPTFNEFKDNYPLDESDGDMMESLILGKVTGVEASRPADTISDSAETVQIQKR